MAAAVADDTSFEQVDGHIIPSVQTYGQNDRAAVLRVLAFVFKELGHRFAVNHQAGAGGRVDAKGEGGEDGEGEAVDAGAGHGEDASFCVVVVTQVEEDMLIGDGMVFRERAVAPENRAVGQADGEGAAAGWK